MTLNTAHTTNGVEIHAYVDVYVNGTKTGTTEVTLATSLNWTSDDTTVATVSKSGNKEVVKYLLSKGADIDSKVSENGTPLIFAIKNNCFFDKKSFHLKVTFVKIMIVK